MSKFDALFVGAGLFNAVMASEFVRAGKKVLVLERREHAGGNCSTYEDHGIIVHEHGAHIFHTNDGRIWEFANRFGSFHPFINSPLAMVYDPAKECYRGYNLPFNMNTFNQIWGVVDPATARDMIEKEAARFKKDRYDNLEEKALSLVGGRIYDMFIKGYTEKQWGRPCTEIPADIITRIPLRFKFDNNYFNDTWQGIPDDGYTRWIEAMLEGCTVEYGVDYLKERDRYEGIADMTFYSGRIDDYFNSVHGELPYRSLEFRTQVVHGTENVQGVAVTNWPSPNVDFTRRIEHRHFMSEAQQKYGVEKDCTIVTTEYPARMAEGREAYYPVLNADSNAMYSKYIRMKPRDVEFTGRLGRFEYNDMDDTISKALCESVLYTR